MILRAFKSLYESGTAFSEKILPKVIGSKPGVVLGAAVGIASVVTGVCFLAAIPISVPMFLVAHGMFAGKGAMVAAGAAAFLGSVGTVVATTGLGMMRAAVKGVFGAANKIIHHKTAAAPERGASFDGAASSRMDFNKQAAAASPPSPQPSVAVANQSFTP